MKKILLERLRSDQRGLTTVEYVIVLCLITMIAVGAWSQFGETVKSRIEASTETLDTVPDSFEGHDD